MSEETNANRCASCGCDKTCKFCRYGEVDPDCATCALCGCRWCGPPTEEFIRGAALRKRLREALDAMRAATERVQAARHERNAALYSLTAAARRHANAEAAFEQASREDDEAAKLADSIADEMVAAGLPDPRQQGEGRA